MNANSNLRVICASVLVLALVSGGALALNMNNICALLNDGMMIASSTDCASYFVCAGGIATMQSCAGSLYFDKDTQQCVQPALVNCTVASAVPCAGSVVGTFAPTLDSCSDFYYCGASGAIRGSCPVGDNFNSISQTCEYSQNYPCTKETVISGINTDTITGSSSDSSSDNATEITEINLCMFIKDGVFFGSAALCNAWNICHNNVLQTGLCPTNYSYSVTNVNCFPSIETTCLQLTNDPELIASQTTLSCTTLGAILPGTSCNNYYLCDGAVYRLMQCASDQLFDTISQQCVARMNARNDCNRCVSSTSQFVNMYSTTNCTGYLICNNGVETGQGFCPAGAYFDELAGGCVVETTMPLYGCCNPNFYVDLGNSTAELN